MYNIDNMRKFLPFFLETLEVILISVLSVILIRTYLVQPFLVWGSSMAPNFSSGDYILIDELSLRFREIERGEVVVFKSPMDSYTYFIKRVIGLPGERILINDNKITIFNESYPNGLIIKEPYLSYQNKTINFGKDIDVILDNDEYFVLGDNRQYSYDSRAWGPVKKENIIGIARVRLWPIKAFSVFAAPRYVFN